MIDYLEFPPFQPSTEHIAEQMDKSKKLNKEWQAKREAKPTATDPAENRP